MLGVLTTVMYHYSDPEVDAEFPEMVSFVNADLSKPGDDPTASIAFTNELWEELGRPEQLTVRAFSGIQLPEW